ncbi:hypothetical protein [Cypionkella psychrotolerans]|uniref:hypothetical protein n=1 Tax=Cypionkella psychrotolerans TaxID=1678131 RepID=UPI0009E73C1F|nr:hypothetical protein [Cypionkella psychrotolerans]
MALSPKNSADFSQKLRSRINGSSAIILPQSSNAGPVPTLDAYAERIVIRQNGLIVGEHARAFGRGQTIYNPWCQSASNIEQVTAFNIDQFGR